MEDRKISTTVALPMRAYVELRERAEREQRSLASVVREALQRGLDRDRNDTDRQHEGETT